MKISRDEFEGDGAQGSGCHCLGTKAQKNADEIRSALLSKSIFISDNDETDFYSSKEVKTCSILDVLAYFTRILNLNACRLRFEVN